mgnify:CR=1 FL=1
MLLMIDNYDSFTYNLYQYLCELGAEVEVVRNDKISLEEIEDMSPEGIIISPGPATPLEAGISNDVIRQFGPKTPTLGVCLGHQCIGQAFGAKVVRAPKPMHGKISEITHNATGVLAAIPSPFKATRYHSLTLEPGSLPDCLEITAESDDGVIQGIAHRDLPLHGVQFHPESIASDHGHQLIQNFLDIARGEPKGKPKGKPGGREAA